MNRAAKPLIAGAATILIYLAVVILTTPALPPDAAVRAAFEINAIVILGMGAGIGVQVWIAEKRRALGCAVGKKRLGSGSSAAATSFFSFFALVPLGCCGWWLYALSLLPSIVGAGASAVLIEHSQALAYLGLAVIFAFNAIGALRLRKDQKSMRLSELA